MNRPILFLTGFMGAGKTTVGRMAAELMGRPFLDLDERIEEEAGMDIPAIFAREGEAGFRRRETEALLRLAVEPGSVVALGGGTFCFRENRETILSRGVVAWLDCSLRTCLDRSRTPGRPPRPLLQDPESVVRLYRARGVEYARAHQRLDTEILSAREAAARLCAWFGEVERALSKS